MSTSDSGRQTDLVISADARALRDLVEPPPLNEAQLRIVEWYERLVQATAGPHSGDDRGPAKTPPWVKQGPRISNITLVDTPGEGFAYLVEGTGLDRTTEVWVDGRPITSWERAEQGLSVLVTEDSGTEVELLIRTPGGDTVVRLLTPESAGID